MAKKKYNFNYPRDNKKYEIDNIKKVKKVISNFLWFKDYDEERFMYYHLCRNHFNQYMNSKKGNVTRLEKMFGNVFKDNLGKQWKEVATFKNAYHMPDEGYYKASLGITKAWSRKFLRDDNTTGLNGEFEMIIKQDGERVDAQTHHIRQETYNFGRTSNVAAHYRLDMVPHGWDDNYLVKKEMGYVLIVEPITIRERVKKKLKSYFE